MHQGGECRSVGALLGAVVRSWKAPVGTGWARPNETDFKEFSVKMLFGRVF
jgi:hypothetical protein